MDSSGLWNYFLLNSTTPVCVRPDVSIVPEIPAGIDPLLACNDTNSSVTSSDSSIVTDKIVQSDFDDDIGLEKKQKTSESEEKQKDNKRSIQRIRYSKEEYKCTTCPYTCTTEKAFLRHVRWCEPNNKTDKDDNQIHLMVSCPICGKDRKNEETLSIHMVKHKQDRYFCCDVCKFKSFQLKKLIQHRRMHTGEKPHLCPFCSYRSSRRDNLRSHVRRVHKKSDLPCDTFTPRSMILIARTK